MDLPIIITAAVLNSVTVCMLFIAALRLLSSTKVLSADLTATLRTMLVRHELIHLASEVCILYLMPLALSSMLHNSVAQIWIMSLIQWYYVSNAMEATYEQNSLPDYTELVTAITEATKMREPRLFSRLSRGFTDEPMTISPFGMGNIMAMQNAYADVIESTSEQNSVADCTEPVITNAEATKMIKPCFFGRLARGGLESMTISPTTMGNIMASQKASADVIESIVENNSVDD